MRSDSRHEVEVSVGDGNVVLRRSGQSRPVVAGILGVDRDTSGEIVTIWLDRIVHRPGETSFTGWDVNGAVSTVLRKQQPKAERKERSES